MRFLADECCDFAVVRALRAAGHDVVALAEVTSHTDDTQLMAQAAQDGRIVLTEDKDFGWLTFVAAQATAGVVLVRFPADARARLGAEVVALVTDHSAEIAGAFTVLQPGQARITRPPRL